MNKTLSFVALGVVIVVGVVAFILGSPETRVAQVSADYKNATYKIQNKDVTLVNGSSEVAAAPGSASKIVTKIFGNEVKGDFNGDGTEDVAFILTQSEGGSGTFYYEVAALKTANGYQGTNAILLGDRIAPQTTEFRNGEVIVNYAERKPGEPMTTRPSIGVSKYLAVQGSTLVEKASILPTPSSGISGYIHMGPTCPVEKIPPDPKCADKPYVNVAVSILSKANGTRIARSVSDANGKFEAGILPGNYMIIVGPEIDNPLPRCNNPIDVTVSVNKFTNIDISCDTGIR